MNALTVSAPGKLYLLGEYGVLAGGWSLVSAVDRRVVCRRRAEPSEYRVTGASFGDSRLVECALKALGDRAAIDSPEWLETDVSAFYDDEGDKLGLGSSAASTVSVVAAASDGLTRPEIFEVSEEAHRLFQGGRGSGGGMAAATWGGLLAYRLVEPLEPYGSSVEVTGENDGVEGTVQTGPASVVPLHWPEGLEVRAVWLGSPASTTDFIARLERGLEGTDSERLAVRDGLDRIAVVARDALEGLADGASADTFLSLIERGDAAMEQLGQVLDASIVIDRHRELRDAVQGKGAAVKPSGAGGGDFSVVVGTSHTKWAALEEDLPSWATLLDLGFGADGVRAE
jgi:ERG8-type phosphomevalonate kinase